MKMPRRNTALYRYLVEQKVLDKGPEAMAQAKRQWRTNYLREKKKHYRASNVEFTLLFKPADARALEAAARRNSMRTPEFIRLAAISYVNKCYLVPRNDVMHAILQQLMLTRSQIERIKEKRGFFTLTSKEEQIEEVLHSMEEKLNEAFSHPKDLELLVQNEIANNAAFAERLKKMLDGC